MKIITAANKKYDKFLKILESQSNKLNYDIEVYDLGDLGRGIPSYVTDESFIKTGNYCQVRGPWWSKALHKPIIVEKALNQDPIVYMDADAFPVRRFDEIWDTEFDIAVTLRDTNENIQMLSPINAGVVFFSPSAQEAVQEWRHFTNLMNNDQLALAKIIKNPKYNIKKLPAYIYNYYKFPEKPPNDVAIYHFKGDPCIRSCFDEVVAELPQLFPTYHN